MHLRSWKEYPELEKMEEGTYKFLYMFIFIYIFNWNFKVDLSMDVGTLTRLDQLSYVAALLLKKRRSKLVKFSRLIENGIITESFQ